MFAEKEFYILSKRTLFMDLSEAETREKIIDPRLKDEGWREEYLKA